MKTINVSELPLAKEVFEHKQFIQALYEQDTRVMGRDVSLNMHGEEHRARRAVELAYFESAASDHAAKTRVRELASGMLKLASASRSADAVELARYFAAGLAAYLTGIDVDRRGNTDIVNLGRLADRFAEAATLVHSRRNEQKVLDEVDQALREFRVQYYEPSRARRQGNPRIEGGGLLARYLGQQAQLQLTDDALFREIVLVLHSAFAPTAISIVNILHELFMWIDADRGRRAKLIEDGALLRRCVLESLRLHPVSPVAWRKAVELVKLSDGQRMDRDDYAVIDLVQVNRDKRLYGANASEFNPFRTSAASVDPTGLSFGAGFHACPGRRVLLEAQDGVHLGLLASLIRALLVWGIRQDPARPAQPDRRTERAQWGAYPVIFDTPPSS